MSKLLTSITILVLLTGCKKAHNRSSDERTLIGKWEWVSSCGGIAGDCTYAKDSPDSLRHMIEFTRDNQFLIYRNNKLIEKYTYQSYSKESPYNRFSPYIITSYSKQETGFRFEGKNTLQLLGGCCDMFDSEYSRVK